MRLDKYLKVSRIIKRRTVANDACDGEHVVVNGRVAKASYDVKEGDIIMFHSKELNGANNTHQVIEIKDGLYYSRRFRNVRDHRVILTDAVSYDLQMICIGDTV